MRNCYGIDEEGPWVRAIRCRSQPLNCCLQKRCGERLRKRRTRNPAGRLRAGRARIKPSMSVEIDYTCQNGEAGSLARWPEPADARVQSVSVRARGEFPGPTSHTRHLTVSALMSIPLQPVASPLAPSHRSLGATCSPLALLWSAIGCVWPLPIACVERWSGDSDRWPPVLFGSTFILVMGSLARNSVVWG